MHVHNNTYNVLPCWNGYHVQSGQNDISYYFIVMSSCKEFPTFLCCSSLLYMYASCDTILLHAYVVGMKFCARTFSEVAKYGNKFGA